MFIIKLRNWIMPQIGTITGHALQQKVTWVGELSLAEHLQCR